MDMKVGFEEILSLEHFWSSLEWRLREKVFEKKMEQLGFWVTEAFRALKDRGIRILEKGIRIAYVKFWKF